LVAENTQFVHACVLAEIDLMALIGGIWGEKLEVFNWERVLGPTSGLDVGRRSREGRGVEKVENAVCVRASLADHPCRFSVPTRETCVRCF